MLPEREPVPENGRKNYDYDEEEGKKKLYGRKGTQDSEQGERGKQGNQESDKTKKGKTEELDPNEGRERKHENEEERRRRAAVKGKRPMSILGRCKGGSDADYYDYDCDYPQNLAILRTIMDYKCRTGEFPHPPSGILLDYIMFSLPYLKISRENLAKKIRALENNYNDSWELDEDKPGLDRPVDREILNLSKRLWGSHKEFYDHRKWK